MRPEVEQELAHTLLVELLAYQFASPVRWIETQDVILEKNRTERIVEIGPADTLGGMARRTLASKYEAYDAATSVQRQVLAYNKDLKEIYYDVDPVEDEPAAPAGGSSDAPPAPSSAPAPASGPAPAAAPAASAGPAAAVADAPVQAVDVLRALVAQKLKKPLADIPLTKAIKDLVGVSGSLHYKMKFWETWAKSLDRHRKSQKTHLLTSWVLQCKRPSMASWVSSLRPWWPAWSPRRCQEASTSQQSANTWRQDSD